MCAPRSVLSGAVGNAGASFPLEVPPALLALWASVQGSTEGMLNLPLARLPCRTRSSSKLSSTCWRTPRTTSSTQRSTRRCCPAPSSNSCAPKSPASSGLTNSPLRPHHPGPPRSQGNPLLLSFSFLIFPSSAWLRQDRHCSPRRRPPTISLPLPAELCSQPGARSGLIQRR